MYSKPESSKTPMLTVPALLEWFDGEVEDLKAKHKAEKDPYLRDIIQGQWLYVELMAAKITDAAFNNIEKEK